MSKHRSEFPIHASACPNCGACKVDDVWLTRTQVRLYNAVLRGKGHSVDLHEAIDMSHGLLKVHVHRLNQRLELVGLRVVAPRGEDGYQLTKVA